MAAKLLVPKERILVANDRLSLIRAAAQIERGPVEELLFRYDPSYYPPHCAIPYAGGLRRKNLNIRKVGVDPSTGIVLDYIALQRLFDALGPENVITPFHLVIRSDIQSNNPQFGINGYAAAGHLVEFVPGESLKDYYFRAKTSRDPSAVEEFINLANQLIDLLRAAHKEGVGHGDANYGNVRVTDGKTLRLTDPYIPPWFTPEDAFEYAQNKDNELMVSIVIELRQLEKNVRP